MDYFWRGLFFVTKPIGLAYSSKVNLKKNELPYRFCLVLLGAISKYKPRGLIFGGAI